MCVQFILIFGGCGHKISAIDPCPQQPKAQPENKVFGLFKLLHCVQNATAISSHPIQKDYRSFNELCPACTGETMSSFTARIRIQTSHQRGVPQSTSNQKIPTTRIPQSPGDKGLQTTATTTKGHSIDDRKRMEELQSTRHILQGSSQGISRVEVNENLFPPRMDSKTSGAKLRSSCQPVYDACITDQLSTPPLTLQESLMYTSKASVGSAPCPEPVNTRILRKQETARKKQEADRAKMARYIRLNSVASSTGTVMGNPGGCLPHCFDQIYGLTNPRDLPYNLRVAMGLLQQPKLMHVGPQERYHPIQNPISEEEEEQPEEKVTETLEPYGPNKMSSHNSSPEQDDRHRHETLSPMFFIGSHYAPSYDTSPSFSVPSNNNSDRKMESTPATSSCSNKKPPGSRISHGDGEQDAQDWEAKMTKCDSGQSGGGCYQQAMRLREDPSHTPSSFTSTGGDTVRGTQGPHRSPGASLQGMSILSSERSEPSLYENGYNSITPRPLKIAKTEAPGYSWEELIKKASFEAFVEVHHSDSKALAAIARLREAFSYTVPRRGSEPSFIHIAEAFKSVADGEEGELDFNEFLYKWGPCQPLSPGSNEFFFELHMIFKQPGINSVRSSLTPKLSSSNFRSFQWPASSSFMSEGLVKRSDSSRSRIQQHSPAPAASDEKGGWADLQDDLFLGQFVAERQDHIGDALSGMPCEKLSREGEFEDDEQGYKKMGYRKMVKQAEENVRGKVVIRSHEQEPL